METLDYIIKQTDKARRAILERKRLRYSLAKELGLPSAICGTVAGWSEVKIRALADEYQAKQNPEPISVT